MFKLYTDGILGQNAQGQDAFSGQSFFGINVGNFINQANGILDRSIQQAIPYSERGSQLAIDTINNFYRISRNDMFQQQQQARKDLIQQTQLANAKLEPYVQSGYGAQDKLMDILGLPRFAAGSAAIASAQQAEANKNAALSNLKMYGNNLVNQLPNLDPQSRTNLINSINSGANPAGIVRGLEQMGITQSPSLNTNYSNPNLSTVANKNGTVIPSMLGTIGNNLNKNINTSVLPYLMNASPAYQQYKQSAYQSPTNAAILSALNNGTGIVR
ncbi:MAG: hypothetical protein ACFFD1_00085 [Candidatus Thorarchaeota archaeon]